MQVALTTIETGIDIHKGGPTGIIKTIVDFKAGEYDYIPIFSVSSNLTKTKKQSEKASRTSKIAKMASHIPGYRLIFFVYILIKFNFSLWLATKNRKIKIHAHDILSAYFSIMRFGKGKIITSIHCVGPYYNQTGLPTRFNGILKTIEKSVLRHSKYLLFPSQGAINLYLSDFSDDEEIISILTNKDKTHVVHNGIDIEKIDLLLRDINFKPIENKVITVANFIESKGVEKIPNIALNHPNLLFEIIGEGELLEKVAMTIEKNAISNLVLSPKIPKKLLIKKICESSIFLMTSTSTVFDLVMLEAMYLHGPILVASNISGHNEMLTDTHDGLLVDGDNYDGALKKIDRYTEVEKTTIKNNAKDTVIKYFTTQQMIKNYEKFYT